MAEDSGPTVEDRLSDLERRTLTTPPGEQEGVEAQARANQIPSGEAALDLYDAVEKRVELDEQAQKDRNAAEADASGVEATDAARELAVEEGIDLSTVEGTGADGQITKGDVQDAIAEREAA